MLEGKILGGYYPQVSVQALLGKIYLGSHNAGSIAIRLNSKYYSVPRAATVGKTSVSKCRGIVLLRHYMVNDLEHRVCW